MRRPVDKYTVLAAIWGVVIFLPYPALPAGGSTGVQMSHLMLALLTPLAIIHRHRIALAWYGYLLLAVPMFVGVFAQGFRSFSLNAAALQGYTFLVIPVTALIFQSRPRTFLAAVCAVISLHGAVGIWQWFAFPKGEFPLGWIFINPSFSPFDAEAVETYVEYIKRPFGITPEPSSMMTMVMAWVLLLLSAGIDGSTRNGVPFFRLTRLRLLGLAGMLFTMVISESGGVAFFGAGLAALVLINVGRHHHRRPGFAIATVAGFVVAAVFTFLHLQTRVASETGQQGSWDERGISIKIGFRLIRDADVWQMLFGYGGGEVSRIADRLQSTSAVHSWFLSEIVGYGLLGVIGLIGLAILIGRAVSRSGDPLTWAVILGVWMIGPSFLTSYNLLPSSWAFLAIPLSLSHLGVADQLFRRPGKAMAGGGAARRPGLDKGAVRAT